VTRPHNVSPLLEWNKKELAPILNKEAERAGISARDDEEEEEREEERCPA
jgi:hypothetical protein